MKRVTLDELDEPMKSLIRNAATEETVVVDQGVVIAEIRVPVARTEGRRFPPNHWDTLSSPRVYVDSTDIISMDRDR